MPARILKLGGWKPWHSCKTAFFLVDHCMMERKGSMEHESLLHAPVDAEGGGLMTNQTENASTDVPRCFLHYKTSDWRAPAVILGFACLENVGFCGISTNLVIYLSSILHESNASIATSITTWSGTCFFTPCLGALLADSYLGSYKMILFSSLFYLLGMGIITLSALLPSLKPPKCEGNQCPAATDVQKFIFYSGLNLVAFGSGGVKSSLLPLGADQFNGEDPKEAQKKASFFNLFYLCINVGALASSTVIVWIQQNVDWAIGYGIATLCIVLALGSFLIGTSTYRLREPGGSPLKRVFQVLVASFRNRKLRVASDGKLLYEVEDNNLNAVGIPRLAHTDQFRCLDKAAIASKSDDKEVDIGNSWKLCTVTQVEELKVLLRLFPIWVSAIIFSVVYAQMCTTFVEQGRSMETRVGSFSIPPASLSAFEVLSVMFWVLLYDKVISWIARSYLSNGYGLTQIQRMGIGYFLIILAMAAAAIVEVKRRQSVHDGKLLSIMWQLPQFFVIGGSEAFTYIGQLEFFYDQGPDSMRSMSTALSLLSISLGSYLSSLIVSIVAVITSGKDRPGWIPDDLNEGHLDYFFWWLAGLSTLNLMAYLSFARKHLLKRRLL